MTLGACNTGGEKKILAAGKNDQEDADAAGAERNREINAVEANGRCRLHYSKQLAATILGG